MTYAAPPQSGRDEQERRQVTSAELEPFREAVAAMNGVTVRQEIELGPIRPPQRLAPFSYALGPRSNIPTARSSPSDPRATPSAA